MPIYFRADKRSPTEIFATGFSPRVTKGKDWWYLAIKANLFSNKRGFRGKSSDADEQMCVCMTTKLESTPIFPVSFTEDEIYLYAIALPEATQIQFREHRRSIYLHLVLPQDHDLRNFKNCYIFTKSFPTEFIYIDAEGNIEKEAQSKELDLSIPVYATLLETKPIEEQLNDQNLIQPLWKLIQSQFNYGKEDIELIRNDQTPTLPERLIIDLHSFQSSQVGRIAEHFSNTPSENLSLYAGYALHAYETLAYQVPGENIIGAIKIARSSLLHQCRMIFRKNPIIGNSIDHLEYQAYVLAPDGLFFVAYEDRQKSISKEMLIPMSPESFHELQIDMMGERLSDKDLPLDAEGRKIITAHSGHVLPDIKTRKIQRSFFMQKNPSLKKYLILLP